MRAIVEEKELGKSRGRQSRYEIIKDLVAEDLVAARIGAQMHGDNSFPSGTIGARGVLHDQHALLGLLGE